MKTTIKLSVSLILCCILTACSGGWSSGGYTFNCVWDENNNIDASFYDAHLLMPYSQEDSENRFENNNLENLLDYWSLYRIMDDIQQWPVIAASFDLKWTTTISSSKPCSSYTESSRSIICNKDNYMQYFTESYQDILKGTPHIQDGNYINPTDHKHDFVLQIHEVENQYNGKIGTITWKYQWRQPNVYGVTEWDFIFPHEGVICTFTPDRYYLTTRNIYIDGQFRDIPYIIL